MQQLRLLPFSPAEIQDSLKRFEELDESVQRNFGLILLATMTSLAKVSETYRAVPQLNTPGKGTIIQQREQAKALITFAGKNQYRLPQDIYSKLLRLEVLMG